MTLNPNYKNIDGYKLIRVVVTMDIGKPLYVNTKACTVTCNDHTRPAPGCDMIIDGASTGSFNVYGDDSMRPLDITKHMFGETLSVYRYCDPSVQSQVEDALRVIINQSCEAHIIELERQAREWRKGYTS